MVKLIKTVEPEVPLRITTDVTGLHAAFAGAPVHEIVIDCVDPFSGVTVNMNEVFWPGLSACVTGVAEIVKSGAALTVCVKAVETLAAKFEFPA